MPVDKYRNQGPDDSEDYHLYEQKTLLSYEEEVAKFIKDGKLRNDDRKFDELRKIYLKTGVCSSVKGSSYIEVGNTKLLVSVHEPREIPRLSEFSPDGQLNVEYRMAPFSGQTRRPLMMQNDEKDLSLMLKRALEPAVCRSEFPNCQVDIYVMVLDDDGSAFAAAVTAAGVAIADAGIPMFDTVAAVTLGFQNEHEFLDPTHDEEKFCNKSFGKNCQELGLLTVVYLSTIDQISSTTMFGCLTADRILEKMDLLIERCRQVTDLSKSILVEDVLKKCKEEEEENSSYQTET